MGAHTNDAVQAPGTPLDRESFEAPEILGLIYWFELGLTDDAIAERADGIVYVDLVADTSGAKLRAVLRENEYVRGSASINGIRVLGLRQRASPPPARGRG